MFIVGVDEAGRGPVLGPLVICAFAVEEGAEAVLKRLGARDSKLLHDSARERIAEKIKKYPHAIVEVSAAEITAYMQRKISLNEMEAEKAAEALLSLARALGQGNITKIFVDSPDPQPEKFAQRIRKYLKKGKLLEKAQIISENKADYKYPVVGGASILAKSMREKRMGELRGDFGDELGSGYPSDERTIEFLKKNHRDPKLQKYIRHRWGTMNRIKTTDLKLNDFW